MENNELKPCPFCGGEATVVKLTLPDREETKEPYVICKSCHTMSAWYMSREEAIEAWNRRVNDELNKVYCKRYREKHPEKIKEYKQKYRDEHSDEIIAYNKQRYEEHNAEIKERSKNYYHTRIKNNPETMAKRREYCRKWRENRRAENEKS